MLANKCLDRNKSRSKESADVWYEIQDRHAKTKGVVRDWDLSVEEFIEAVGIQNNIINVERLCRKRWNREVRKTEWVKIGCIKLT